MYDTMTAIENRNFLLSLYSSFHLNSILHNLWSNKHNSVRIEIVLNRRINHNISLCLNLNATVDRTYTLNWLFAIYMQEMWYAFSQNVLYSCYSLLMHKSNAEVSVLSHADLNICFSFVSFFSLPHFHFSEDVQCHRTSEWAISKWGYLCQ